MTAPREGIHLGMSKSEYISDPCEAPSLSASIAKVILSQSPAHAREVHPRLNPKYAAKQYADTPAMTKGDAIHRILLEGEQCYVPIPYGEYRTDASKDLRQSAIDAGLIPLRSVQSKKEAREGTPCELERVLESIPVIRERIQSLAVRPPPLTDGQPEVVIVWREPNGVWCRGRLDWLRHDLTTIEDLKTTASANPGEGIGQFGRQIWQLQYHIQDAFYRRGVQHLFRSEPEFRFIAVELDGPGCSICALDSEARAYADAMVRHAIYTWGECLGSDQWPGYDLSMHRISVPPYIQREWEARVDAL